MSSELLTRSHPNIPEIMPKLALNCFPVWAQFFAHFGSISVKMVEMLRLGSGVDVHKFMFSGRILSGRPQLLYWKQNCLIP